MFDIDTDGVGAHTGCDYQWAWFRDNGNNLLANGLDKLYKQMGGNAVFLAATLIDQMKKRLSRVLAHYFSPKVD
jgi:hypothetical protein